MKSKMEIEAPTFDLGIESDFEDQNGNRIPFLKF
jgi:hypothetical protein